MPLVEGGYDEWAKAGKPSSGTAQATTDTFDKIAAKSTKKSKTTGKSPQDTAIASIIDKTMKTITKNATAAAKQKETDANKAVDKAAKDAADRKKVSDKAYSDQAGQIDALNKAWPSRILPKDFDPVLPPLDTPTEVGTTNLKDANNPPPSAATVPVIPAANDPNATPPLSPEISAAAQAEYQRTGQMPAMTTDKVQKLQAQIDASKSKIAAVETSQGKQHRSFWGDLVHDPWNLGNAVDAWANVGTGIMDAANSATEIINRPESAIVNAINDIGNPDKSVGDWLPDVWKGLAGQKDSSFIDVMNANRKGVIEDPNQPGRMIQWDPATNAWIDAKPLNPYLAAPVALGGDILINPGTWFGASTVAEGAKGIMAGSQALDTIDVNNATIKSALQTMASNRVQAAARSAGKNISKQFVAAGGPIGNPVTQIETLANDLMKKSLASGESLGKSIAAVRVAVENEVAGDAAKQALATRTVSALKSNRRVINLKVAGKEIPLGKVPIVDLPYQGARALKAKAAGTEIGQGLSKMFSTNYWFPGETHTLWDKANSKGVASFTQAHDDIQQAFKGLSTKDRIRVADATEQGIPLAGEIGTKGHDLGPAQKFFKDMTDKHFAEDVARGKYSAADKVGDFVYHHYRNGSPTKIREIKAKRKIRLTDGATGADRLTLQEAHDLKLNPVREADKILLAHTAEHERAMINDAFHRSAIQRYGHVMDNPIAAQKLGLESVKPPKNMSMAPGHQLYMHPDVKRVYNGIGDFMGKTDEETKVLWRKFDKLMRGWKIGNTTLRPAHHIRNAIGDTYLNYLDGVQNPYRYEQGLKMVSGGRAGLKVRVGNQVLTGDDIFNLASKSGMNKGFISSEFLEGKNRVLQGIQNFSEKREMAGRYAHFIDVLVKEGKKQNLGANNSAGLYKIMTEAGKRVNKWNINYGDLTPFERNTMKRVMPFYTWTRKAMPLMFESLATRPGRVMGGSQLNNFLSNVTGQHPNDTEGVPYPQWLKDAGFARISGGTEPNVFSVPLPTQDLGRWFGGGGNLDSVAKEFLNNINPLAQLAIERGTGRSLYTGGQIDPNEATYGAKKLGIVQNILDASGITGKPDPDRLNSIFGFGTRKVTEASQLSELRRQQDPVQVKMNQLNKELGDFEVHKLKNGYSVYNKATKKTERSGFTTPEQAMVYASGLSNQAKGK